MNHGIYERSSPHFQRITSLRDMLCPLSVRKSSLIITRQQHAPFLPAWFTTRRIMYILVDAYQPSGAILCHKWACLEPI